MSVKREYKSNLDNKLNQLWYQGHAVFERWELLSWYGKDRITNVVWRDINDAWEALFVGTAPQPLQVIKCDDTTATQKYIVVNSAVLHNIENLA
jgi:hypothetical protein